MSNGNDRSDYLFHYTSLENLALILKNRTIRLGPLSKVDDLQESRSKELKNLGRFVFVSCWTDESEESIPMWNMYGKMESGVRIGLPKNPFVINRTTEADLERALGKVKFDDHTNGGGVIDSFINIADMIEKNFISPEALSKNILHEVRYTDDINLLEPKTILSDSKVARLDLKNIGMYKNKYWEFQKEWRYLLHIYPLRFTPDAEQFAKRTTDFIHEVEKDNLINSIDYYDLQISPDSFRKMIITENPRLSLGNRILLSLLVEKYNPDATICESSLKGKI